MHPHKPTTHRNNNNNIKQNRHGEKDTLNALQLVVAEEMSDNENDTENDIDNDKDDKNDSEGKQ